MGEYENRLLKKVSASERQKVKRRWRNCIIKSIRMLNPCQNY
jgi:hypothetical protein